MPKREGAKMRVKFTFSYSTTMTVIFDDKFEMQMSCPLDQAAMEIQSLMLKYEFCNADVIDSYTGEILMQAKLSEK